MDRYIRKVRDTLSQCNSFVVENNPKSREFEEYTNRVERKYEVQPMQEFVNSKLNRVRADIPISRLNQTTSRYIQALKRMGIKADKHWIRNRLNQRARDVSPPPLENASVTSEQIAEAKSRLRERAIQLGDRLGMFESLEANGDDGEDGKGRGEEHKDMVQQYDQMMEEKNGLQRLLEAKERQQGANSHHHRHRHRRHHRRRRHNNPDDSDDDGSSDNTPSSLNGMSILRNDEPLLARPKLPYVDALLKLLEGISHQIRKDNSRSAALISAADRETAFDGIDQSCFRIYSDMAAMLGTFFMSDGGVRSEFQAELHRWLLRSSIPLIHRSEWDFNSKAIREAYNIEGDIKMFTWIGWGRRCGKSVAVCMFFAAVLLCMEGPILVACISTGLSAVQELFRMIMQFVTQKDSSYNRTIRYLPSGSRPMIVSTKPGQRPDQGVTLIALPKGTATNRGGRKIDEVLVDEGSYVKPDVWGKVIMPALRLNNVLAVFLSSIDSDSENHFTRLGQLKDANGNDAFNIVRMELVCPDCRAARIMDCPHYRSRRPQWLVNSDLEQLIANMFQIVDPASYYAEFYGISNPNHLPCFKSEMLNRLMESAAWDVPETPVVYVMVDYGGGGIGSDTSLVTMMITPDQHVLVGLGTHLLLSLSFVFYHYLWLLG